jgi:RNA polymerase sigma-70 factor, ECF subfamily
MDDHSSHKTLFRRWWEEHRGIVFKITRSFARTPVEAGDLEQELWLQIWNSISAFSGDAKPSTWIYCVCLNTAMTWRRSTLRRERRFDSVADLSYVHTHNSTPAQTAGDTEVLEKLYAAIHALPDLDRALVLLSLDEISYQEIAKITGLTEGRVGMALTRARKRLANQMKGVTNECE